MSKLAITVDDKVFHIDVQPSDKGAEWTLNVDGAPLHVILPANTPGEAPEWLIINDHPYEVIFDPELRWLQAQGRTFTVGVRDLDTAVTRPHSGDGRVKAPIPGQITRILVKEGERVEPGTSLMILEAMKMENHVIASLGGRVRSIFVASGETVPIAKVLAEIDTSEIKN